MQSSLRVLLRANLCTLLVPVLLRLLLLLVRFAWIVLPLLDLSLVRVAWLARLSPVRFVFLSTAASLVLPSSIFPPAHLCGRRESDRDENCDAHRG